MSDTNADGDDPKPNPKRVELLENEIYSTIHRFYASRPNQITQQQFQQGIRGTRRACCGAARPKTV
jgi:hypothetical protein